MTIKALKFESFSVCNLVWLNLRRRLGFGGALSSTGCNSNVYFSSPGIFCGVFPNFIVVRYPISSLKSEFNLLFIRSPKKLSYKTYSSHFPCLSHISSVQLG